MSRPNIDPTQLISGQEAWDALLRDLLTAIAKAPFPVAEYDDFASLPDATTYDRCLAATIDDDGLWFAQAGVWNAVSIAP